MRDTELTIGVEQRKEEGVFGSRNEITNYLFTSHLFVWFMKWNELRTEG